MAPISYRSVFAARNLSDGITRDALAQAQLAISLANAEGNCEQGTYYLEGQILWAGQGQLLKSFFRSP